MRLKNRLGDVYDDLTVIGGPTRRHGLVYWDCRCKCGNVTSTHFPGKTKSCGCRRIASNQLNSQAEIHGQSSTPIYGLWKNLRRRHGCDESWDDFRVFAKDVGERPSPKHKLKKLYSNRMFSKKNFKWKLPPLFRERRRNTFFSLDAMGYNGTNPEGFYASELSHNLSPDKILMLKDEYCNPQIK